MDLGNSEAVIENIPFLDLQDDMNLFMIIFLYLYIYMSLNYLDLLNTMTNRVRKVKRSTELVMLK